MQSGELIVVGKNSIHISLDHAPAEVKVHFIDENEVVPCNSQDVDSLEYTVQDNNNSFVLIVTWSVSGTREIKWKVSY